MDVRCDAINDCSDNLDEEGCDKIETFAGYDKFFTPHSAKDEKKHVVNISLDIRSILTIDEKEGFFETKFNLLRSWYNPKLNFLNLKRNEEENLLSTRDKKKMWLP